MSTTTALICAVLLSGAALVSISELFFSPSSLRSQKTGRRFPPRRTSDAQQLSTTSLETEPTAHHDEADDSLLTLIIQSDGCYGWDWTDRVVIQRGFYDTERAFLVSWVEARLLQMHDKIRAIEEYDGHGLMVSSAPFAQCVVESAKLSDDHRVLEIQLGPVVVDVSAADSEKPRKWQSAEDTMDVAAGTALKSASATASMRHDTLVQDLATKIHNAVLQQSPSRRQRRRRRLLSRYGKNHKGAAQVGVSKTKAVKHAVPHGFAPGHIAGAQSIAASNELGDNDMNSLRHHPAHEHAAMEEEENELEEEEMPEDNNVDSHNQAAGPGEALQNYEAENVEAEEQENEEFAEEVEEAKAEDEDINQNGIR